MRSEVLGTVGRSVRRTRARPAADRGMVTLELAACLPVVVLIVAVAVSAISVANTRVRAQDAREAARLSARGDVSGARRAVAAVAPGARVDVRAVGPDVLAAVHVPARVLVGWLPPVDVDAQAVAAREP